MWMIVVQSLPGSKYDENLQALRNRYPGSLDSTTMDRYLGMVFLYNSDTGVMTASMYHSIVKILRASSLPVQQAPYTMNLFDPSDDLARSSSACSSGP